jgi:hypothetical protein
VNAVKNALLLIGLGVAAATIFSVATPAGASPVPPVADISLLGTWVNAHPASANVAQVVITSDSSGTVDVDAFGNCTPTLCEFGSVPAIVYGANITATSGSLFQSNQAFYHGSTEWQRVSLLGSARATGRGQVLTLTEQSFLEDGSGRRNETTTETFVLGAGQPATISGNAVNSYVDGAAPNLLSGARGTWTNTNPGGNVLVLQVSGSVSHPSVHAVGNCIPACDLGAVNGIVLGKSVLAAKGATMVAPYSLSFKNLQLEITYKHSAAGDQLVVGEYSEFTDGSRRSNYVIIETFVRS